MARRREDPKQAALREARCLNPRPEAVADEGFTAGPEFFDARDLGQGKYEMVRPVRAEGQPGDVARYEQLREQVLGGQPGGWRLGLGVLHNRGVAAWLAAWDGLPVPAPPQPPGPPARPVPGSGEQLVSALAAMALSCLAARG